MFLWADEISDATDPEDEAGDMVELFRQYPAATKQLPSLKALKEFKVWKLLQK